MSNIQYTISGTCSGYESFLRHSKNIEKEKINLIDNRGYDKSSTKSKTCYSISIQEEYYIFSKIQIIRDGLRSQSIGFVKFNLIIPIGFKLSTNIISVLDDGLGYYTDEFVDKNFVLIDENKKSDFEDKIEKLLSEINLKQTSRYNWKNGSLNPAFIYFNNNDLPLYLAYEHIFQNEYEKYHEVYFINENDTGEDSILKALKHEVNANLTDVVNIKNPSYTITTNQINNEITCDRSPSSEKVKLGDNVDLNFSRKHHKPIRINGTWKNLLDGHSTIIKKSTITPYTIEIILPDLETITKEILNDIPITINLEGEKEKSYTQFHIIGIVLFIGLFLFGVRQFWPFGEAIEDPTSSTDSGYPKETTPKNTDTEIREYLKGDELIHDTLQGYSTSTSTLKDSLDELIKFRDAIDGDNRNEIENAYKIKGLSKTQNSILELILEKYSSEKFDQYKEIKNRNLILLKNFEDTLKTHIDNLQVSTIEKGSDIINKVDEKNNNVLNGKSSKGNESKGVKYSEIEFLGIIKENSTPTDGKMTKKMQSLFKNYNKLESQKKNNISGQDFNDLKSLEREIEIAAIKK